ncbi:hypothetical protein Tco_1415579, partial [Tanacetum coccineum]
SVTDTVMSSDSASSEEPDSPEAAPASPDYVPGPKEPEQALLLPDYVPGPEYAEYLAPSDEEVPVKDHPYVVADSPIALSPGYVADSDPDVDSEDGPIDYPADEGDNDDDDSSNNDEAEEEEEEEHLAPADSAVAPVVDHVPSSEETEPFETDKSASTPPSPPAWRTTARISIRPEAPILLPPEEKVERLLALPTPPPLPLISLPPPSAEERLARAAMGRLRASSPIPPPVPAALPLPPLPSSPLPPLPDSLFIPLVDRKEDIPEAELPPRKRVDYGFVGTLDAEAKRQRAEAVGYGIRDTWVDPRETAEEVAPVTFEGVNTRVNELAAVQEQDTQDIYAVIEDTRDRQTHIHQTVEALVDDRQYHYETARLLDQEALVSREAWAHSMGFSSAVHYELQGYRTHVWTQDHRMDVQDSLIAALTAHVSSLQGYLATALGEIRALQAREQARADVPEGTGSSS